ncbi:MAG: ubiquinol-cytochrome c reductase iron-sulfur subunit [Gammaproteobacteria bacterium]
MSEDVDASRRHFLTVATTVTGVAGTALAAAPFLFSLKPSARAEALGAPVEIDISKLDPGGMIKVEWRGKPVWALKRTPEMLEHLEGHDAQLRDPRSEQEQQPEYAANEYRSIRPEVLVLVGTCTHLGCSPLPRLQPGGGELGADWPGGFYCPCHGSKFDLAGRVYKGVPAPLNLLVPPYSYLGESVILVGSDTGSA